MIIMSLGGGLGNQMFQYALGRKLAIKNNVKLNLDLSLLEPNSSNTPRKYMLDKYMINAISLKKNGLFRKLLYYFQTKYNSTITEDSNRFQNFILDVKNHSRLIGYWQSYKYFQDIREKLVVELSPRNPVQMDNEISKIINNGSSVSIHIRRGDYVTDQKAKNILGSLSYSYYKSAIDYINKRVKNPKYIILSDDINWCRKYLTKILPKNTIFFHGDEITDLEIMKKTRHNIIANSTFSWWGAYLGEKEIVIAPKKWFNSQKMTARDLIPTEWILL